MCQILYTYEINMPNTIFHGPEKTIPLPTAPPEPLKALIRFTIMYMSLPQASFFFYLCSYMAFGVCVYIYIKE